MAMVRPVDIVKTVYYGAEASEKAGMKALAHTVYDFKSQDGKKILRTVTRTVSQDSEYGTKATWTKSDSNAVERIGKYTNRTREVKTKNWFCTNTSSYKLDDEGKYVKERKLSWVSMSLPGRFGENFNVPCCGEKLDVYENNSTFHYINDYLMEVTPPEKRLIPNCTVSQRSVT